MNAEEYYNAINEIKYFCISEQIKQFSTIRLEGLTTLTCYERIRTMFRYVFKNTDIEVTIYKEQCFTKMKKKQIIREYYDTIDKETPGYIPYSKKIETKIPMEKFETGCRKLY